MKEERMSSWPRESSFNLLVDYYPEVISRPYGSGCTRENILPWLKALEPGYICVYAKGHGGYTTWPSSLGTAHPMLARDMPALFRELTREAGCRLVLYYSGLLDGLAGTRHPEWVMRNLDGSPSSPGLADFNVAPSYPICPLGDYWEEWVSVQLSEIITRYRPDGIWVDGDWPGPCYCPLCLDRFRMESGFSGTPAEMSARDSFRAEYARAWNRITHQWRTRFSRFVKTLDPGCAYSAGNISARREYAGPFDWRSGDFFSPGFYTLADMARMMRWYGTLDKPCDAYLCDTSFTHRRKEVPSRSKTTARMLQEAAVVAANGGAVGYWTYPLGNGALVPSRMKRAVAVARFTRERESVFRGTRAVPWSAVLAADESGEALGDVGVRGAHLVLAGLHRSPQVMDDDTWSPDSPHSLLVIPEQRRLRDETAAGLEKFLRRGGRLLTSGRTIDNPVLRGILGVSGVEPGALDEGHVLPEPGAEPVGLRRPWDRLRLRGAVELYPLYLSWDQFNPACRDLAANWPMHGQVDEENPVPAGFPAAVSRRVGRGLAVHLCAPVFRHYGRYGDPGVLAWLAGIAAFLQPRPFFSTDAPSWVDVTLRADARGRLLIHFVSHCPGRDLSKLNGDDLWVDEIPPAGPFEVRLITGGAPSSVTLAPGGRALDFEHRARTLRFSVPRFEIHACIAVEGPAVNFPGRAALARPGKGRERDEAATRRRPHV